MSKRYSYDPECKKLAEYFISNQRDRHSIPHLAQAIQEAVEDFLGAEGATAQAIEDGGSNP